MNTTVTHDVEGTDLPTYESGFTGSGYLYLGGGVRLTIADRHVEYLRQLVIAAEGAIERIEARGPKPEMHRPVMCRCTTTPVFPEVEPKLQHPGTWLLGDRIQGAFEWTRKADYWFSADSITDDDHVNDWMTSPGFRITHLVPRKAGA